MHRIEPFRLERYFGEHEFRSKFLLSASDCETVSLDELVGLADAETSAHWRQLKLGYTESQGLPQLRTEIARMYDAPESKQPSIGADNVVIGAPEELIFIAMSALLSAGDQVICLTPAYQSLHEIARSLGCDVVPWNLVPSRNTSTGDMHWSIDLDKLSSLITPQTKMIVLNFPHNPTGFVPSHDEFNRILSIARDANGGLIVFSDEMYRLLEHEETNRLPSCCSIYPHAVTLSGMSKAFGLPGLRIGWLASPMEGFSLKILALKDYTTICSSGPSEVLAWIGLRSKQLVDRNRTIIHRNVHALLRFCQRHPGRVEPVITQGGSTAFVRWKDGVKSLEAMCETALTTKGLMIVPGGMFDAAYAEYFRVGLGRNDFEEALALLDDLMAASQ